MRFKRYRRETLRQPRQAGWQESILMLSPAQERQFWIDEMKRRHPYGMAVNCKGMPSLDKTPILRKLIEDGILIRVREPGSWVSGGNRTIVRLA